jgi:hypothetical protein
MGARRKSKLSRALNSLVEGLRDLVEGLREFASVSPPPVARVPLTVRPRVGVALGGGFARGLAQRRG